jgi:hypothetical protein
MNKDYFAVEAHLNLTECPKTIDYFTSEPYDADNDEHFSVWAVGVALSKFDIGDIIELDEWWDALYDAKLEQVMSDLADRGLVNMTIDADGNIGYALTETGKKKVGKK